MSKTCVWISDNVRRAKKHKNAKFLNIEVKKTNKYSLVQGKRGVKMAKKKAKQVALRTAGGSSSSVGLYLTGIVAVVAVVAVVIMILNVKGGAIAISSGDGITGMAIKGGGNSMKCREQATTMIPSANPRTGQRSKLTPMFDSEKYKACINAGKAAKMGRITASARAGGLGTDSRVLVVDSYDAYKRR